MSKQSVVAEFRSLLAKLYPDEASQRRVAADAGLDETQIAFHPIAQNSWRAIWFEAEKANKVNNLLDIALREYEENPKLQKAWLAYRNATQSSAPIAQNLTNTPSARPRTQPGGENKFIDIFLSYSRQDARIMRRLYTELLTAGFSVWIDDTELELGSPSWQAAIEQAIHAARCMVVISSPAAKQSKWIEIEVSVAEESELRVFPVLAAGDPTNAILFRLRTTQRIDVRADWQAVKEQLIPALHRHLGQTIGPVAAKLAPEVKKPKQVSYHWRWVTGMIVLLFLVVGVYSLPKLWTLYRPRYPATPPQSTPMPPTRTPSATNTLIATSTPAPGAIRVNPIDGAVYVWIPGNTFTMGSTNEDKLAYNNEKPAQKVSVDGFWMMQTEVTNAQYASCVTAGICEQPANNSWNDANYAKHPVVAVSWVQAKTYAEWVKGRLPSEAEWEYACRGPDGRIYPWGNQTPSADRLNYADSSKNDTMPAGSYPAGANGLYDMAGNVWEWASSLYKAYPYTAADGREDLKVDGSRTLRGGSFGHFDLDVRCAARGIGDPHSKLSLVGFRVVSPGF